MLEQNQLLEFTATPSFCNSWPEISVEANGVCIWQGLVSQQQRFCLPLNIQEHNKIHIKYLNKRKGPVIWDTVTDDEGKIIEDQNCIISKIYIARSRCDFLIKDIEFYGVDGTQEKTFGFMSQQGYLLIEFPGDVYSWILNQRQKEMLGTRQRTSALDYWTNYISDSSDADRAIIQDIRKLLVNDTNTGN
jgi:hypothetical protein